MDSSESEVVVISPKKKKKKRIPPPNPPYRLRRKGRYSMLRVIFVSHILFLLSMFTFY